MTRKMTRADIREIAAESGLSHAEFCVEQHTTQIGRKAAEPLWEELRLLMEAAWNDPASQAPSNWSPDA